MNYQYLQNDENKFKKQRTAAFITLHRRVISATVPLLFNLLTRTLFIDLFVSVKSTANAKDIKFSNLRNGIFMR